MIEINFSWETPKEKYILSDMGLAVGKNVLAVVIILPNNGPELIDA